ncbi:fasciclin domain-containing protein [Flagellimonas pacifica]|uniref:Uncaracterized surface protein containing fasciclin (FAS1) repeats n=1 Tax=Flagellimonas pacifica TaxID=1247520 RepID=A0A285MZ00_9FLAO|nr:fasciclin domain-containing protein [Allomuricauda parva]SNZ00711.1 Uncaracterized surface protein containing fasciclin (FAS1) repeats [Allomuricauda parva]
MKAPFKKVLLCLCLVCTFFVSAQNSNSSTSQNTIQSNRYTTLFAAVKATEMQDVLDNSGPYTVFAPSNAAFERFSNAKMEKLINATDKSDLKSLVTYHIVPGRLTASKILRAMCKGSGKASFTTIQGKKLVAHMEGYDIILTDPIGNTARITTADVNQKNGIMHEIDSVILPTKM